MSKQIWEAFGKWLKTEREKARLSQKEVAKQTPLHIVQLSRIENGHSGAKRQTVIDIVNSINILSTGYQIDLGEALQRAGMGLMYHKPFPEQLADLPFEQFSEVELWKLREIILLELKYKRVEPLKQAQAVFQQNRENLVLEKEIKLTE